MIPRAGVLELLQWSLGRRTAYSISGDSMLPTFVEGQRVLGDPKAFRDRPPRVGEVVVARHPFQRGLFVIKRVEALVDGRFRLLGDNPQASSDSRTLGDFELERIVARVTSTLEAPDD